MSGFAAGVVDASLPGDLVIGAPDWVVPTLIVGTLCTCLVIWNYSTGRRDRWSLIALLLKLAGIALLAVCLLQPMRSGQRPRPRANLLPIIVDDSRSMNVAGLAESDTWHDRIKNTLADEQAWPTKFAQTFDLRTYAFESRLREFDSVDDLNARGNVSRLSKAVADLASRLESRPVAAAILMSDGNESARDSESVDWSKVKFPVYPVVPSGNRSVHDLRIIDTSVRQTNFESAPVTLSAKYDAVGMSGRKVIIQVRDETDNKLLAEKTNTLGADGEIQSVTFRIRPETSGLQFYRVLVFTEADRELIASGAVFESVDQKSGDEFGASDSLPNAEVDSSETTLLNNGRYVTINRDSGPYRVLYLAGRANWEFKFLRRAMEEDAEVQLIGLLRIAKEEPKFSFRDRGISESNPLFQGIDNGSAAAEQYDEPVIIRLGVAESEELSKGFPKTAEELFDYHAIILDDIETDFFTQDQMLLIRQFVASRGGGLLFLGGKESFDGKRFADTPLGELSPFYESSDDQHAPDAFQFSLTREGALQPWLRLRETEAAEVDRMRSMASFRTINAVGPLKPGALELASVSTPESVRLPALASQRFGKGRCAALPVADMWRWSMNRNEKSPDDPEQAWRQIVRWLVSEVPQRVRAEVSDQQSSDGSVLVTVQAHDEKYLGVDNATISLKVTPPDGQPLEIQAEQAGDAPGIYSATYWPRDAGAYHAEITAETSDGAEIGITEAGWTTQPGGSEFDSLRINSDYLSQIAEQTGGRVLTESQVGGVIDSLPSDRVPVTETWVYPIWHRPWIMIVALLCFCMEWGIRRWRGMV